MIKTQRIRALEKARERKVKEIKELVDHLRVAVKRPHKINQYALVIIVDFTSSLLMGKGASGASMCVGNASSPNHTHLASIDGPKGVKMPLFETSLQHQKQFHKRQQVLNILCLNARKLMSVRFNRPSQMHR